MGKINNKIKKCSILFFTVVLFSLPVKINSQEDDLDSITVKREQWFFYQRSFPYDSIPHLAYANAIEQSNNLKSSQGYYLGSQTLWTSLGPNPVYLSINNWDYSSGRVSMIRYAPNNSSIVYLAGAGGGLWKSENGGTSWVAKPNDYSSSSGCIAIDPGNSEIIYYGTGEMHYGVYSYYGNGLLKSTDGGTTWRQITNGLPTRPTFFSKIAIRPNHSNELLAACGTNYTNISIESGLYRSTDYGESWGKIVPSGEQGLVCFDVAFSPNGEKAYIVGPNTSLPNIWERGVGYRISTDGGASFSDALPNVLDPVGRAQLSVCKSDGNILFVIVNCGEVCNKLYKSTDAGNSFTLKYDFNDINHDYMGWYNLLVSASPYNSSYVFCGTNDLYRSTDGGDHFDRVAGYCCWYVHADMHYLEFSTNQNEQNTVMVGNDGGVWKSTDLGDSWINLNSTLSLSHMYRISANPFIPYYIVGGIQDMGFCRRTNNGLYWNDYGRGYDGGNFTFSQININTGVGVETPEGGIVYTLNGGANFSNAAIGGVWDNQNDWLAPIVPHPTQEGIFFTARRNDQGTQVVVWKTTDNGANWPQGLANAITNNEPPQNIAICNSLPDNMYVSVGSYVWPSMTSHVFKTSNGGNNWSQLSLTNLPDRYISHIEVDPQDPNQLYITLSGFNTGHIFKSTDGGASVFDLTGSSETALPNSPSSDIIIRYIDCTNKQLIVATDVGVYKATENGANTSWQAVADGLPVAVAMDLDYTPLSGKFKVATFGRGVWETDLADEPGTIYVKGYQYINSDAVGVDVNQNIVVCSGGHLQIPYSCTVKMAPGAKITVMEGGTIDASSGNAITFTSQSGTWGGIEIQGSANGTLRNCTFTNTTTPVAITGGLLEGQRIYIDDCTFSAPVSINNRNTVTVENSHWNYGTFSGPVACVYSIYSNQIDISYNDLNTNALTNFVDASAISVLYGEVITIVNNNLNKCAVGIDIHNSNVYVNENNITSGDLFASVSGISLNYAYSSTLRENTINGYPMGIYMYSSSPTLYINRIDYGSNNPIGINMEFNSLPRLRPIVDEPYQYWDAGYNFIFNESPANNQSISFAIDYSLPDIGTGYNRVKAALYYINGCYLCGPSEYPWHAEYTCWSELPPNMSKFNFTDGGQPIVDYYTCDPPPGAGGEKSKKPENPEEASAAMHNLTPLIVHRGNGVYDTIQVTQGSHPVTSDKTLYFEAMKEELSSNFSISITLYQQVIQNYQDSSTAILSMKRILKCRDQMQYDSSAYFNLRGYYLSLAQNNPTDTSFSNVAGELAVKCLVRLKNHEQAITEYENIIANTTDSLKIFGCELNIIELYIIMSGGGGDNPSFTGSIASLKPASKLDGLRMLNEKLHGIKSHGPKQEVPLVFRLYQNYPNPFNPLTKIDFAIPKKSNVTLKVYDILGRLVTTLVNDFREAGIYTVQFDGTNLSSGVYFYTIEAGEYRASKKMVLVK